MKLNLIITGATGMVGEGVLHEALRDPNVECVLIVNRKPSGVTHLKLKEIVHNDFFDLTPIESQLAGYDACLFCLGVTSVGKKEAEYRHLTYDLTMNFARTLADRNPNMTFCYISGMSTDSTEHGKYMWARVKGKTENDLMKLPFKRVYAFRPGYIHPMQGMRHTQKYYKYITWMYPFLRLVVPNRVSTLGEVAQAMLRVALRGYPKPILEVSDINSLAHE